MKPHTPAHEINDTLLRAGVYRTLTQAFSYPDQDMVAALKMGCSAQLQCWKEGWLNGVRELLVAALDNLQYASLTELGGEYVRLFGPAARCLLTETSWGDATRLCGKPVQIADISGF